MFPIEGPELWIGRDPGLCSIILDRPGIGPRHALIRARRPGRWMIQKGDSGDGVWLRVEEAGEHVAHKWILTRGADNIRDLLPGPILPPVIDKELLVEAEKELGQSLRPYQEAREWLRDAFWARVHRQFGVHIGKSKP